MAKLKDKIKGFHLRLPKTKGGKIAVLTALICLIIFSGLFIRLFYTGDIYTVFEEPDKMDETTWHKWNKRKTNTASFVSDTTYDGSSDVPFIVYDIPFRSPGEAEGDELENMYNSNKNVLAAVDDSFVEARMEKAKDYVDTVFGQSYKTVSSDSDVYIASVLDFYLDPTYFSEDDTFLDENDEEGGMDLTAFASALAEFYVDNNITASYEWLTDESLFYRTQYQYTTRGIVKLTLTSKDHEKGEPCTPFKELFGVDVNYGEDVQLILNIGFGAWYSDNDTLGIGLVEIDSVDHAAEVLGLKYY